MTVIKLKSGELWVHAPIAPTKECIQVTLKPTSSTINDFSVDWIEDDIFSVFQVLK